MLYWQTGVLLVTIILECMYIAEIKMPPFTNGKKQLEKVDVDWSRELSLVRIHVERVIGVLNQKYTVLQSILPVQFCDGSNDE